MGNHFILSYNVVVILTISSSFERDVTPLVPNVLSHLKEPSALINKEKGLAPVFLPVDVVCDVTPCKPL